MLWADLLAFAAFDAVRSFPAWRGMYRIVVVIGVPVVVKLLGVHGGEQIRDGDVFRTAISAVTAGSVSFNGWKSFMKERGWDYDCPSLSSHAFSENPVSTH